MKRRQFAMQRTATPSGRRYIYGVHPIAAWLCSRPSHVCSLYYEATTSGRIESVLNLAHAAHVPSETRSADLLSGLAGTERHQGVAALCKEFPYVELGQVVSQAKPLIVLADQIQDPQNLGALLRTADAAGAGAVLVPKDQAAPVTGVVEVAAAGAAARIAVCQVTNAVRALEALKQHGYWVVGLIPKGGIDLFDFDPPTALVVVVGGERGMRPLVLRHCDFLVSIPMFGGTESLNAATAAAVAMFEIQRHWRPA